MPDAPGAPRLAVTIPKEAAKAARSEFREWGLAASARIIGENEAEVAFYLGFHTSLVALALWSAREDMERRVKKVGGRIGAKDEWVAADRDLGDFLSDA